jgi:hypothetical protein
MFFCYHYIDMKFPPLLVMTNSRWGTNGHTSWVLHLQPNFLHTYELGIEPQTTCLRGPSPLTLEEKFLNIGHLNVLVNEEKIMEKTME